MALRKMRLADHRGRDATVVLVPRRVQRKSEIQTSDGRPVQFTRLVKVTERTSWRSLAARFGWRPSSNCTVIGAHRCTKKPAKLRAHFVQPTSDCQPQLY